MSPFHNQFQIPVFSDRPHDTDGASCAVNFTLWKAPCAVIAVHVDEVVFAECDPAEPGSVDSSCGGSFGGSLSEGGRCIAEAKQQQGPKSNIHVQHPETVRQAEGAGCQREAETKRWTAD